MMKELHANWTPFYTRQDKLVLDGGQLISFKAIDEALQEGYIVYLTEWKNKDIVLPVEKRANETIKDAIERTIVQVRLEAEHVKSKPKQEKKVSTVEEEKIKKRKKARSR